MKVWIPLAAALALLVSPPPVVADPGYPVQFRGVCQHCGHDLIAVYRPVACIGGSYDWQWVPEPHHHCRPVWKGREKFDFFNSHLVNPANPKRKAKVPDRIKTSCCGGRS